MNNNVRWTDAQYKARKLALTTLIEVANSFEPRMDKAVQEGDFDKARALARAKVVVLDAWYKLIDL